MIDRSCFAALSKLWPRHGCLLLVWAFLSPVFGAPEVLKTLSPQEISQFLKQPDRPYAWVVNPRDTTFQSVDLVWLEPGKLKPVARGRASVRCARVSMAADGTLLCVGNQVPTQDKVFGPSTALVYSSDLSRYTAYRFFDSSTRVSRARISLDGQRRAWTLFARGHSYLDASGASFSTEAWLAVGTRGPQSEPQNLESWPLIQNGKTVSAIDKNIWGITFHPSDPDRFLATAQFNGAPYLVEGRWSTRQLHVIAKDVECPSYSPSGNMIAFKRRVSAQKWVPAIMSMDKRETTVFRAVPDSVDDQIVWLNDTVLLYEVTKVPMLGYVNIDLMTLDITQGRQATHKLWLADARSPAHRLPR
jgi:hypothetical protein